jgi:acetyl esterase/lipase
MKKIFSFILITITLSLSLNAQKTINIWEGPAPTNNGLNDTAQLIVYTPQKAINTKLPAVLICPGGGYAGVSMPYEGHAFAKWLSDQGFIGIVLKYRLPNQHKEIPFDDVRKSMEIIEKNAEKWNIDKDKIGIAGFSAGGHLAAVASNLLIQENSDIYPRYTILFYPVISLKEVTKGGTRNNLLGLNPTAKDILAFSAEELVNNNTPPSIIFMSDNDNSVSPTHSTMYYNALKKHNIPASLYIFPTGGHGWGMLDSFEYKNEVLVLLKSWLTKEVLN